MFSRLDFIEGKYEELSTKISDPSVMADQKEWQKLCKEQSDLEIIVTKYNEYKKVMKDTENDKEMLQDKLDKELKDMVEEELKELSVKQTKVESELKVL